MQPSVIATGAVGQVWEGAGTGEQWQCAHVVQPGTGRHCHEGGLPVLPAGRGRHDGQRQPRTYPARPRCVDRLAGA